MIVNLTTRMNNTKQLFDDEQIFLKNYICECKGLIEVYVKWDYEPSFYGTCNRCKKTFKPEKPVYNIYFQADDFKLTENN